MAAAGSWNSTSASECRRTSPRGIARTKAIMKGEVRGMRYALLAMFGAVATLSAQVPAPLQIVTDSLPPAATGVPYLQQLTVTGGACQGTGTATSSLDSGALPP